jgi:hypothetical protein
MQRGPAEGLKWQSTCLVLNSNPNIIKKKKDDSGIGVCDKDYITNQQEEIKTELTKQVNSIRTGHRNGQ